jgi:hypothetical protein
MADASHLVSRSFVVAWACLAAVQLSSCGGTETTTDRATHPAEDTARPDEGVAPAAGGAARPSESPAGAVGPSTPAPAPVAGPDPATLTTCADVQAAYGRLVANRSCTGDADCQVLGGHCSSGLGGCAEAVNRSVTREQLHALARRWNDLGCLAGACRCMESGAPICQGGVCEEAERP